MKNTFIPKKAREFFSRANLVVLIQEILKYAMYDFEEDEKSLAECERLSKQEDYPIELLTKVADIFWEHLELEEVSDDCVDDRRSDRANLVLKYYNLPTSDYSENE